MPRPFNAALIATIALLLLPSTVLADDDRQRMLELSDIATEAVSQGQFELAAVKFREAYDTYPDAILLNNEMVAWFQAEDCSNALRAAHRYLETDDVEDDDIPTLMAVQKNCHLQLAEEAVQEQNRHLATYHVEQLSEFELEEDEQDTYESLRQDLEDIPAFERADDGPGDDTFAEDSGSHTLAWAQISGGVALAGIGVALHAVALDRQSQLRTMADSDDPQDALRFQEKQQEWGGFQRTTRWAVPTLYTLGALSIGSGIFMMTRDRSSDDGLAFAPSLSTERVGLSFSGRF